MLLVFNLNALMKSVVFRMKVITYDIIEIKTDLDVKQVSFEELLTQADVRKSLSN